MWPKVLSLVREELNNGLTDGAISRIFVYRCNYTTNIKGYTVMNNIDELKSRYLYLLKSPIVFDVVWNVNQKCTSKLLTWDVFIKRDIEYISVVINVDITHAINFNRK